MESLTASAAAEKSRSNMDRHTATDRPKLEGKEEQAEWDALLHLLFVRKTQKLTMNWFVNMWGLCFSRAASCRLFSRTSVFPFSPFLWNISDCLLEKHLHIYAPREYWENGHVLSSKGEKSLFTPGLIYGVTCLSTGEVLLGAYLVWLMDFVARTVARSGTACQFIAAETGMNLIIVAVKPHLTVTAFEFYCVNEAVNFRRV